MLALIGRIVLQLQRVERLTLRAEVLRTHPHLRGLAWDPATSHIDYARLRIGSNCSFGSYAYVFGPVSLGDNVMVANHCAIGAGAHRTDLSGIPIRDSGSIEPNGIEIGNDVWLAHGATVIDGVRIGEGSVIGAGSVVTHDIPPYMIAAGVPCRPLRHRF